MHLFPDQHCSSDNGLTRPIILVTASVDRMLLKRPIRIDTDLKIVGAVTWVGRSSMEIQLVVIQPTEGTSYQIFYLSDYSGHGRTKISPKKLLFIFWQSSNWIHFAITKHVV